MRFQKRSHARITLDENLALEAEAHDVEYKARFPYGLDSWMFTRDQVWRINDRPYKKGAYRRGSRKRRLFELMDLERLSGKKVLDVGCGIGQHSVFFAMYGAQVSGFDISPEGIALADTIARHNGLASACDFRVATVSEMPYEDASFDVVVFNAVLHHVWKYPRVREETWRVLKPNGLLFFAEGVRDNPPYRWLRSLWRLLRPATYHGDIDLQMSDITELTSRYEDVHIERFALLEKLTTSIGRDYGNPFWLRAAYFISHVIDKVVATLFPPVQSWCLDAVGRARKPGPSSQTSTGP